MTPVDIVHSPTFKLHTRNGGCIISVVVMKYKEAIQAQS